MKQWTEADSTGNPTLDEHHRMLFRMTADFRLALEEGRGSAVYGLLLDSLETFAAGHFAFEEGCANRSCCPVAEENAAAHQRFLQRFRQFGERYDEHGYRDEDAAAMCDFLEDWLHQHIRRVDVHLKSCAAHPTATGT